MILIGLSTLQLKFETEVLEIMDLSIKETLYGKAIIRGGIEMYKYDDAITVIELCSRNNIQVLGIDAFSLSNEHTQPVQEHSIDFTSSTYIENNRANDEAAHDFIESKKHLDLVFEIVY